VLLFVFGLCPGKKTTLHVSFLPLLLSVARPTLRLEVIASHRKVNRGWKFLSEAKPESLQTCRRNDDHLMQSICAAI